MTATLRSALWLVAGLIVAGLAGRNVWGGDAARSLPSAAAGDAAAPLALDPANPHYLLFRKRPTVLVTSGEHYGAVLNLDFDDIKYLDELHSCGFNLTRTFSGSYRELPDSFGIIDNTLAPAAGRYIAPWRLIAAAGAKQRHVRFDLNAWDEAYFKRLKGFVGAASRRGIVVEVVLFSAIYDDRLWSIHPFNPANNVQRIGPAGRLEVYTLKDSRLEAVEERLAAKIVRELAPFDNVYYEICNEPYFGGVTAEWSARVSAAIWAAAPLDRRPLIAQNIANGSARVKALDKRVSILNFHYASPPAAIAGNAKLGRAIADDETGFKGKDDFAYRAEAWNFLLAGGAIFDNLDYSFTPHHPDGTAKVTTSPGGGGPSLRKQLAILKTFIEGFDFSHMTPDDRVIVGGLPDHATARALVERGRAYAVYVQGGKQARLIFDLPAGSYRAEWLDTKTGLVVKSERLKHSGGKVTVASPAYREDIALRIMAVK